MRIACIGSRDISPETAKIMNEIGRYIVQHGHYIASGNAIGSDSEYAKGGNEVDPTHVILYLPKWASNRHFLVEGNRVTDQQKPEWKEMARKHHPIYDGLPEYVKKLMDRNAGILSRADACIAYLNHKKQGGGGTGHGWRISEEMGIPRIDISQGQTAEEIKKWLKTLDDF